MSITKFDLYNPEWLELVFDSRNKEYGAYDLRKHYAGNLVKAMAIAFFSVSFLFTVYTIFLKAKPPEITRTVAYDPVIPIPPITKTVIPAQPRPALAAPHEAVTTVKYPVLVAVRDQDAQNPPKITDLETAPISSESRKGKDGPDANISIDGLGTGPVAPPNVTEDNTPADWSTVEVMPAPYGGADAWAKFLQKNIHYPARASEEGKQGKVLLSFIVEKDGSLTNIKVERPMGFGLDEEAIRVLKLAPAWKPGIQNGHRVRVKFVIPVNFQITEPD